MSIKQNLLAIKQSLPESVSLVAISKTKPIASIHEAYTAGQRIFGENKIQEMAKKRESLPKDIQWHMVGHVQTNKVKHMAEFVSLIHGVDSFKLLKAINDQAKKHKRTIDCLLQVHIGNEETKFGLDLEELYAIVRSIEFKELANIRVAGIMGMATHTQDRDVIRKEFKYLRSIFDGLKKIVPNCTVLSMGMSGDYDIAIEEGSTMVRIGSSIFGERN